MHWQLVASYSSINSMDFLQFKCKKADLADYKFPWSQTSDACALSEGNNFLTLLAALG